MSGIYNALMYEQTGLCYGEPHERLQALQKNLEENQPDEGEDQKAYRQERLAGIKMWFDLSHYALGMSLEEAVSSAKDNDKALFKLLRYYPEYSQTVWVYKRLQAGDDEFILKYGKALSTRRWPDGARDITKGMGDIVEGFCEGKPELCCTDAAVRFIKDSHIKKRWDEGETATVIQWELAEVGLLTKDDTGENWVKGRKRAMGLKRKR